MAISLLLQVVDSVKLFKNFQNFRLWRQLCSKWPNDHCCMGQLCSFCASGMVQENILDVCAKLHTYGVRLCSCCAWSMRANEMNDLKKKKSHWKVQCKIFYSLLTVPRTVSSMYVQVAQAKSCANHVQHIECLSHATCHVPHGLKGQFSC